MTSGRVSGSPGAVFEREVEEHAFVSTRGTDTPRDREPRHDLQSRLEVQREAHPGFRKRNSSLDTEPSASTPSMEPAYVSNMRLAFGWVIHTRLAPPAQLWVLALRPVFARACGDHVPPRF